MAPERILLVEDDEAFATLTCKSLRTLGYEVTDTVRSGEEAILAARHSRPALVLMDIGLKGSIDGIEAAKHIRFNFDIPIVFLTGAEDGQTLTRAKSSEPFGYLLKPTRPGDLRTTIEIALSQFHAYRQRAKQAERLAEVKFRTQYESAVAGMFQAKSDGELLHANQTLVRMMGYQSAEEFLIVVKNAKAALEIKFGDDQGPGAWPQNSKAKKSFHLQAYCKDGSTIWVSGTARAVCDSGGKTLFYEGSVTDTVNR